MTTVHDTTADTREMAGATSAPQVVTKKSEHQSSKKHKNAASPSSAAGQATRQADQPGPFEVRVDDAGTVLPSFWRFGE